MYRYLSPLFLFPPQSAEIVYVGGVVNTGPNNASSYTQSISGTLTGGIASSPSPGDLIIVGNSIAITSATDETMTCSGNQTGAFTTLSDLFANDEVNRFNLGVHWAFAGATPDATLTLNSLTTTQSGSVCCVHVWRGVNTGTPFDVLKQEATGTNSANTTPAAITPVTAGARVVVVGGSSASPTSTVDHVLSTGYETVAYARCANTTGCKPRMGIISKAWSGSGAEAPAQWTASDSNANQSWAAVTLALRPAA